MDTSNPPQAVVHNSTIIDWAFGKERQNSGRAGGGRVERRNSRSNGYISTSFMVHANDDTTLIIYSIDAERESRAARGRLLRSPNAGFGLGSALSS
jgi:hypothetical protein